MVPPGATADQALERSVVYLLLGKALTYPTEALMSMLGKTFLEDGGAGVTSRGGLNATIPQELQEFLSALQYWSTPERRPELEAEYNRLFAHAGSSPCPPYETEFGYSNIFQKTDAMADIAGFYRAYGLEPAATGTERVDFISTELEFMSYLTHHEAYAREHNEAEHLEVCLDTQRKFLRDHLGRWTAAFADILSHSTANSYYTSVARFLASFIASELESLGVTPEQMTLPGNLQQREAEPFACEACIAHQQLNDERGQQAHVDG